LEAGDVGLEGLFGDVLAARVDRDSDGGGQLACDTSFLELSERETTSSAYTAIVLDGGASNDRTELVNGTRCDESSLLDTVFSATVLATRL